jgi:protein SCO1
MNVLKIIRYAAWAAVFALAAVAGLVALGMKPGGNPGNMPLSAQVGGPFALTSQEGRPFTDKDLMGKPFALFFGFTNCPDICPTTLLEFDQSA